MKITAAAAELSLPAQKRMAAETAVTTVKQRQSDSNYRRATYGPVRRGEFTQHGKNGCAGKKAGNSKRNARASLPNTSDVLGQKDLIAFRSGSNEYPVLV